MIKNLISLIKQFRRLVFLPYTSLDLAAGCSHVFEMIFGVVQIKFSVG